MAARGKKEKEDRTQDVRGNKVSCSYLVVGYDFGLFSSLTSRLQPIGAGMASHDIPRGSPWHSHMAPTWAAAWAATRP